MKNKITILILILIPSLGYSQESKAYLGVSFGAAFPGGDLDEDLSADAGADVGFNFGYRFTEQWGATVNFFLSNHTVNVDLSEEGRFRVTYFGLGPMYTFIFPDKKISWDIKPQLTLLLTGVLKADGEDDITLRGNGFMGNGFILGNSINFEVSKGIELSANIDYLTGKFTKAEYGGDSDDLDDDADGISKLSLGVGFKVNF